MFNLNGISLLTDPDHSAWLFSALVFTYTLINLINFIITDVGIYFQVTDENYKP